jgi:hypothetical protein
MGESYRVGVWVVDCGVVILAALPPPLVFGKILKVLGLSVKYRK